jgi:hypothetical protein
MKLKWNTNYTYLIAMIVVLSLVTLGGIKFFKSGKNNSTASSPNNFPNQSQNGRSRGGFNRGNLMRTTGTVSSVSDNTILMKAEDGTNKNVIVSSSTQIMKAANGQPFQIQLSDIKTGDQITVMSSSTSGDIQATIIMDGQFTFQRSPNDFNNSEELDENPLSI